MRINRGFLGWGVFLVLVGAVPLAVRAGYVSEDQVPNVVNLWPLILVGIGIGILLARTQFGFLGGLVIAVTLGLMVGSALATGVGWVRVGGCGPDGETVAFPTRDGSLTATAGAVDLRLNCGNATITTTPGTSWRLEGEDRDGVGPNVNADNDSLSIRSRDDRNDWFDAANDRENWRLALPDGLPLDIDLNLNAGGTTMDLAGAAITRFDVDLNAGSAVVDLGSARELADLRIGLNAGSLELTLPKQSVDGRIEANAGSVALCVPPGVALRIRTAESIVASYDYENQGLVKNGSTWETPGFDGAALRIDLETRANAGSFSLNPEDGCDG
jgi:hypothetical protein